jgi:hypothetical protein
VSALFDAHPWLWLTLPGWPIALFLILGIIDLAAPTCRGCSGRGREVFDTDGKCWDRKCWSCNGSGRAWLP